MDQLHKDRVEKWCQALESDEYLQGDGALRQFNGEVGRYLYCCLGVSSEVSGLGEWDSAEEGTYKIGNATFGGLMPVPVAEYYGIKQVHQSLIEERCDVSLNRTTPGDTTAVNLNDGEKLDFKRIAAIIRGTYLTDNEDNLPRITFEE
jgi:hypothetical protein